LRDSSILHQVDSGASCGEGRQQNISISYGLPGRCPQQQVGHLPENLRFGFRLQAAILADQPRESMRDGTSRTTVRLTSKSPMTASDKEYIERDEVEDFCFHSLEDALPTGLTQVLAERLGQI